MSERSFCVLIPSHGRPRDQKTVATLLRQGYTGDWKIVIDDQDETGPEYIARYGQDRVVVFDKVKAAAECDIGDNRPGLSMVLPARNACFGIARDHGYTHMLQLDDDYTGFWLREERGSHLEAHACHDLDALFETMLDFLDDTGADMVALAQGGDFIGGAASGRWRQKISRKVMNSFFIRVDTTARFLGRMNDDVNMYATLGHRGYLFFTLMYAMVVQPATQAAAGGMTEIYLDQGTYVKSFYSVMMCPSAVDISMMGRTHLRIHHQVRWNNAAPMILSQNHQKAS